MICEGENKRVSAGVARAAHLRIAIIEDDVVWIVMRRVACSIGVSFPAPPRPSAPHSVFTWPVAQPVVPIAHLFKNDCSPICLPTNRGRLRLRLGRPHRLSVARA